jgi:HK97 family phage major capsid protein
MSLTTSSASALLTPAQVADLLIRPALALSVAAQVATVVHISTASFRIPIVAADPTAAFVAEGEEITPSDPTISELTVTPNKCAGLTIISSELANDTSPAAAETVGEGLARDIARRVDEAFFGDLSSPAPAGLESLTAGNAPTPVDASAGFDGTDAFAEAISLAETEGALLTSWVTSPAVALQLAKLREATGSNRPLLAPDPTVPTRRQILGLPVYTSPYVADSTIWGIPQDRTYVVVRQDAEVTADASVFFTSDRVAVRAIMRVGFGFPHPLALVKITTEP